MNRVAGASRVGTTTLGAAKMGAARKLGGPNWQRWGIPIALAASPQVINGRWRKPLISRRRLAELRKEHLAQGLPWEEPAPKFKVAKPPPNPNKPRFKGHKRLRPENIEKRKKIIEAKLKEIPAVLAAQKKLRADLKVKPLKGLDLMYWKPARKELAKLKAKLRGGSGGSAPNADD